MNRLKSNPHTMCFSKGIHLGDDLVHCNLCDRISWPKSYRGRHVCIYCGAEVYGHTAYVADGLLLVDEGDLI